MKRKTIIILLSPIWLPIITLFAIVLLGIIDLSYGLIAGIFTPIKKTDPHFLPVTNLNPQYFMKINGHVDPLIGKYLKLKWIAQYKTTNPSCQHIIDEENSQIDPGKNVFFNTILNNNGDYQLNIPLDYFSQGYCQWKIDSIFFISNIENEDNGEGLQNDTKNSIASFSDSIKLVKISRHNLRVNDDVICPVGLALCAHHSNFGFSQKLGRNNNYSYTFNILVNNK